MQSGLLFRAVSDQSQGTNSANLFAPAAAGSSDRSRQSYRPPLAIDGQKLKNALSWSKKEDSIFTFFTPSLLFAIATASKRKYGGDTNIKIICFDASNARTLQGERVRFQLVSTLMEELGVNMYRSNKALKEFSDVILTTACIVPGNDARAATFDQLELQGLYQLYPYLGENRYRARPKLSRVIENARGFGWQSERPLSLQKIGLAAQLAAVFIGASNKRMHSTDIESHLLASFLGLQKRHFADSALTCWLNKFSQEVIEIDGCEDTESDPFRNSSVPEVLQQQELMRVLKNRQILATALTSNCAVATAVVNHEAQEFEKWQSMNHAQYRAENPRNSDKAGTRQGKRRLRDADDRRFERRPRREYATRDRISRPRNHEESHIFSDRSVLTTRLERADAHKYRRERRYDHRRQ
ncbi:hypothetical protein CBER1_01312 [Cercospora berteroae]|uniref:DUF7587 domain-containing protein n=1 Tax=Cercospora berteroae TaxID=357750 RepID=A0A2S6CKQ0_9PEZI|nr:hypothetical protein CBER1_01312 [Cercospora berteroae]